MTPKIKKLITREGLVALTFALFLLLLGAKTVYSGYIYRDSTDTNWISDNDNGTTTYYTPNASGTGWVTTTTPNPTKRTNWNAPTTVVPNSPRRSKGIDINRSFVAGRKLANNRNSSYQPFGD